jgi:hypothetical protein
MTRSTIDLQFGATFARLWCDACQAETIHHKNRCSCGSTHRPQIHVDKPPVFLAGRNAKAMSRRRSAK